MGGGGGEVAHVFYLSYCGKPAIYTLSLYSLFVNIMIFTWHCH